MIITRQDPFLFRLQTGDITLNFRTDPRHLELKTIHKQVTMDTAGEYEIEGIVVDSAPEDPIFYTIYWDDMVIGLGGIKSGPPDRQSGRAGPPDRMTPVIRAGVSYDILLLFVAHPSEMIKKLANADARILIPFGEEKVIASFIEEIDESPEEMDKLTIKKKDIPTEGERRIVVLKPLKK